MKIEKKTGVTVFLFAYNEEDRIKSFLTNFSWADEVVIFDKSSTDNTPLIAESLNATVIKIPYTDATENFGQYVKTYKTDSEWYMFPTASSLIHPDLVDEIVKITANKASKFEVVSLPYRVYVFGINSARSPWSGLYKTILIKKNVLVTSDELHNGFWHSSKSLAKISFLGEDKCLFHLTHKDPDDFFHRHLRYTKYEANYLNKKTSRNKALRIVFLEVINSLWTSFFKRKCFLLGWDGIALMFGFVSYSIMKFLYVWDFYRENGSVIYPDIRRKIENAWNDND